MKQVAFLWKVTLVAFSLALISCSHVEPTSSTPPASESRLVITTAEDLGQQVARHLTDRYASTFVDC